MIRLLFVIVFILSMFLTAFSCIILSEHWNSSFEVLVSLYLLMLSAIVNLVSFAGIFGEWE